CRLHARAAHQPPQRRLGGLLGNARQNPLAGKPEPTSRITKIRRLTASLWIAPVSARMTFTIQLSSGIVSIIATDWSAAGCVFPGYGRSWPTAELWQKKAGPSPQLGAMADCELPSASRACGAFSPRVTLTAPGCLTMSAEARQTGLKFEKISERLAGHEPPP